MTGKVCCISREPGGAEAIALTVKSRPSEEYLLIGKDYACSVYDKHRLDYKQYEGNTQEDLSCFLEKLGENSIGAFLTSATSLPEQDMTEKYTWQWARQNNIPSVAILDQWQNYRGRFSGPEMSQVLQYLPTVICAMDESAKRGLVLDGIPEERIKITGQPSLARMRRCMLDGSHKERQAIRKQLHCGEDSLLMVFISEPFTASMGQEIGFTEISILDELLSYLSDRLWMDEKKGKASSLQLIIKLHPKNRLDIFIPIEKRYKNIWGKLKIIVLKDEIGKDQLLQASDMVVGMCSIMLMEAVALGKTVVSLQIGAKRRDWCEAVNQGIIPFIATSEDKTRLLDSLLDNEQFLNSYNESIRNYPVISDAEDLIWSVIQEVRSKKIN